MAPKHLDDEGLFGLPIALLIWAVVATALVLSLPLFPVDETRYLTVAWEMRQSGEWLLPTLNGEPYSHKPPMLMWLVNIVWLVGGTEIGVARMVAVLVTAGVIGVTFALGRALFPERREVAPLAVAFAMTPAFFVYGGLLMFDQLLALFILLALLYLWRAAEQPTFASFAKLGVAIGLGLLAKGPVMLLHVLPAAFLVAYWRPASAPEVSRKSWSFGILIAVLIGAVIILSWAIPAAITGGKEFARMIFWEQSAGRMVKSFDHRRPVWFYVPVLVGYLFPLFFVAPMWRGIRAHRGEALPKGVIFLLAWIVPTLVAFGAISGKQPHYLLPLIPGVAIVAAYFASRVAWTGRDRLIAYVPVVLLFLVLLAGPIIAAHVTRDTPTRLLHEGIGAFNPWLTGAVLAGVGVLLALARRPLAQSFAVAAGSGLLIATVALQANPHVFRYFDVSEISEALKPYKAGPIAYVGDYAGEVNFVARLSHPVDVIEGNGVALWFKENPGGVILFRHKPKDALPEGAEIVFSQPFRANAAFSIAKAEGP